MLTKIDKKNVSNTYKMSRIDIVVVAMSEGDISTLEYVCSVNIKLNLICTY
jgi:hypothetical protein